MPILIGEVSHERIGKIRIEISKPEDFIARVKEINREIKRGKKGHKEPMKLWKIRMTGSDRIPAAVQRLIDASGDEAELAPAKPDASTAVQDAAVRTNQPRRPRPGGPLNAA